MSKTRSYVVQAALERSGIARPGRAADGTVFASADNALLDLLQLLHDECPLDFDPTSDAIPDNRVALLIDVFRHSDIMSMFGKRLDETGQLFDKAKINFLDAVIGDGDHIADDPVDY